MILWLRNAPSFDDLTEVWVTIIGCDILQTPPIKITKTRNEVEIDYNQKTITFQLSQEENLKLFGLVRYVQVRYKTQSGVSYVTEAKFY